MKRIALTVIVLFALNGCSKTINRWNNTAPKEYLEVYGKDNLPLTLKAKNVEYKCVDLLYSSSGNTKKCYVEKNSTEKMEGWSSRIYETSKMALLDTGENIVILGMVVLCSMGGDCSNLDFSEIKR